MNQDQDEETGKRDLEMPEDTSEAPSSGLGSGIRKKTMVEFVTPIIVLAALAIGLFLGGAVGRIPVSDPSAAEADGRVWTCSMHPHVRSPTPGQCPICGMELIVADADAQAHRVVLSDHAAKLAKLQTAPIESSTQRPEIHLLGRITIDENRVRTITAWTDGRIDRLFVREMGTKVKRGQVIARLYSEEVYTATRDLIQAKKQAAKLSAGLHGSDKIAKSTVESARERLRLLGMADSTIEKIETSGKGPKHVSVYSTAAGTVIEKHADQGAYVKAGTPLLHVADLSGVWVQVDAYETDLPHVALGQSVALSVKSLPGEVFTGEIAFIDPVLDPRTRTVQVRVEVDNEDGRLRPGMFAEALIETGLDGGTRLVVPASAVLFTGRRSVVYVEVPEQEAPTYEIREIGLGPRAGPFYAVTSGLAEGERVVVEGAFVIDADLQLRGGDSMMSRPGADGVAQAKAIEIPESFSVAMRPVLEHYLDVHEALASDEHGAARDGLRLLVDELQKIEAAGSRDARDTWSGLSAGLIEQATRGSETDDIRATRTAFEDLSAQVEHLLAVFGNSGLVPVAFARCPMAFDGKGASWVQRGTTIANPYFGSAMHRCGDIEATVRPGEHLVVAASASPNSTPQHDHSSGSDAAEHDH